jgi:hypothetical protein
MKIEYPYWFSLWCEPAKPSPTLSSETIDNIAIDSMRWHMLREMEPLQREAFRIVMRYYGVSV